MNRVHTSIDQPFLEVRTGKQGSSLVFTLVGVGGAIAEKRDDPNALVDS